jgi:hypothetical protein
MRKQDMAFDLATNPMTRLNVALRTALEDAGIDDGAIEQNPTDAALVFTPKGRMITGPAILAAHSAIAADDVAVISTDLDRNGKVRIVFARAADGTTTPPVAKETHDAVLDDWFLGHDGATGIVYGVVSGDSKGRWPDGTTIATSPLQAGTVAAEGVVVHTLRTAYLLGRPRTAEDLTDGEIIGSAINGYPALHMRVVN